MTDYDTLTPEELRSAIRQRDEQLREALAECRDLAEQRDSIRKPLKLEIDQLKQQLADEKAIVDRVWKALGIDNYEQAKLFSIDEHVANLKQQLAQAQAACAALKHLIKSHDEWQMQMGIVRYHWPSTLDYNVWLHTQIERLERDNNAHIEACLSAQKKNGALSNSLAKGISLLREWPKGAVWETKLDAFLKEMELK